jgi:hypothetical protein
VVLVEAHPTREQLLTVLLVQPIRGLLVATTLLALAVVAAVVGQVAQEQRTLDWDLLVRVLVCQTALLGLP